MKQILLLKYADIAGQVLTLFPLLFALSAGTRAYAAICYLTVGIWQTTSCIIVAISGTKPLAHSRRLYGQMSIYVHGLFTAGIILALATELLNVPASLLLPISAFCKKLLLTEASFILLLEPVMAIWYATIVLEEIGMIRSALMHRSEIHWKL